MLRKVEMRHYPQLDGLRALAVLAVIAGHAANSADPTPVRDFALGLLGVRLFFVLSGFLITGILIRQRPDRAGDTGLSTNHLIKTFFARRFLRIFPIYYVALAVFFAFGLRGMSGQWPWHATYLTNFYFAFGGQSGPAASHLWSLAVEEQFYLVWPFLVLCAPRKWLMPSVCFLIAFAVGYRCLAGIQGFSRAAIMYPVFACLDSLGLGAMLALIMAHQESESESKDRMSTLVWMGMALVFGSLSIRHFAGPTAFITLGQSIAALGFTAIVYGAVIGYPGPIGEMLASRSMGYIGKISYAMYLFHFPIDRILFRQWSRSIPQLNRFELRFLAVTGVTVLLAAISWKLIENPINGFKRFFPYAADKQTPKLGPSDVRQAA